MGERPSLAGWLYPTLGQCPPGTTEGEFYHHVQCHHYPSLYYVNWLCEVMPRSLAIGDYTQILPTSCSLKSIMCFTVLQKPALNYCLFQASLVAQMVKNLPAVQDTQAQSLGWEDPLKKGMSTHSGILAWRIPWTQEPGRLQSMGSQRVRHGWVTNTFTFFLFSIITATTTVLGWETQDRRVCA